ncbi:hypothetical protein XELAEV_18029763mg [Xenopus laevis]|uniref:ANK_REP_REGION domain-containing protein n=1 Tax=Xenopus laevis TaxID=8355 RepID=A0A974HHW3_XENLA|nr:hypothetical protein XELAEV_18029763mg [Xenopus laevis]
MWYFRETSLHLAAANGHLCVKILIQNKAAVDIKDNNKWTPLQWCSINGQIEVPDCWVSLGASQEEKSTTVMTLLHLSALALPQRPEILKFLKCLLKSALVNVSDINRLTPFHRAAGHGYTESNLTPLYHATYKGQHDTSSILLHLGAYIDSRDWLGKASCCNQRDILSIVDMRGMNLC